MPLYFLINNIIRIKVMSNNNLNVFLSGEIHTDWREEIIDESKNKNLTINFFS